MTRADTISSQHRVSAQAALSNLNFLHENSRTFADYWFSLPKQDLVPCRHEFQAAQVPQLLPYLTIHEFEPPDRILIRLAGTDLVERYGEEITGKNYLDIAGGNEDRGAVFQRLYLLTQQPCGFHVHLRTVMGPGYDYVNETVGFPFRGKDGRCNQVIYYTQTVDYNPLAHDHKGKTLEMTPLRRDHIDIGAGVPDCIQ